MKKINVFLRLGFSPHPIYEDLFNYPPEGVEYFFPKKITKEVHYTKKVPLSHKAKLILWKNYMRFFPCAAPMPADANRCDIIHSTNNVMMLGKKPWLVDIESGYGLLSFKNSRAKNPAFMHLLRKVIKQKSCKSILAWSKISEKSAKMLLGKRLSEKVETIYPAHQIPIQKDKKQGDKITLLFDARRFEHKGGYELLAAFDKLEKKYDFKLNMISIFPEDIKKKYSKNKNIALIPANLTREEVLIYYQKANVFVYPTHIDTFGFVLLQAMANKMPIITTKIFATPEIVKNEKSGFLIEPTIKWNSEEGKMLWGNDLNYLKKYTGSNKEEYVKELVKKVSLLIEDKKLREKMGKTGFREIESGKFSIKTRNKQLRRVYEESLR